MKLNRACSNMRCLIFSLPIGTPCKLVNDNCGRLLVHCTHVSSVLFFVSFWRRNLFLLRWLTSVSVLELCLVFQESESHLYVLHSEWWKWTVLQVQHFEVMHCTFFIACAALLFAWSVNENMLPVTLNHITQKKNWKSWVEGGCNHEIII